MKPARLIIASMVNVAVLAGCGQRAVPPQNARARVAAIVTAAIPHEFDPAGHPTAIGATCTGKPRRLRCEFAYHFSPPAPEKRRVMAGVVTAECASKCRVNWHGLTVTSPSPTAQ